MEFETVSAIGSLVSGLAGLIALVTILYVVRQTKEMSSQTRLLADANMASVYEQVNAMMFEINKIFFEHPEWKKYFYDNEALPNDLASNERGKIETLAEMLADFIDLISVLEQTTNAHSVVAEKHWAEWVTYCEYLVAASPCLREFISTRNSWYDEKMSDLSNRSLPPKQIPSPV